MATAPTEAPPAGAQGAQGKNDNDGLAAMHAAAAKAPGDLTAAEQSAATQWFLSPEIERVASAIVPVNVAPAGADENILDFTVQVIDRDLIRKIRRESERVGADGEKEVDELEANLRICVEGIIDPAIRELRNVGGSEFLDPADALKARFAHKPGLIDQIAGKIVEISGYNDKDVKEVKAAGN